jgi:hypothetical protein
MKKYLGMALFCLIALRAYSQCPATVYVRDLGKYAKVERCEKDKGESINMVINIFNEETYNYGKWKYYYSDGKPRAEGFITLEASLNTRVMDYGDIPKRYVEKRVGRWIYWDSKGNQTVEFYH